MGLKSTCLSFFIMFPYFLNFFSNIHEIANFANKIICISDHYMKDILLSFYLVPILEVYDK